MRAPAKVPDRERKPAAGPGAATAGGAHPRATRLELALVGACAAVLVLLILAGDPSRLEAVLHALLRGNLAAVRARLAGMGAWEIAAVVTLVLAHTVLPFPTELVAAAAGFSLGVGVALPLLLVSLVVSALITYWIGLRLGRPVVSRLVGPRRLRRLEQLVERGGFRALLGVRLFPLVPFSPIGLVCGLGGVPVGRFTAATALGILPELALVTYLGERLRWPHLADPLVWAPLAVILLLIIVAPALLRRRASV
jgi:uncharacterized membrane protein YdjX (TVP38/TMEM64 family)